MFYKHDEASESEVNLHIAELEVQLNEDDDAAIGKLLNEEHMNMNAILRCAITIRQEDENRHLFVFYQMPGSLIYMSLQFSDTLQEDLEKKNSATGALASVDNFDLMITRWINNQEEKLSKSTTLAGLVIGAVVEESG